MITEIIEILQKKYPEYCMKHLSTAREILYLIDDNTGSVSDDLAESSVLHGVSESLVNDRTDADSQSSVAGTFEIITPSESNTYHNECELCDQLYWTTDGMNTICPNCVTKE